ncbi:MoxR-like ATPase [Halogeometricum borinquense DSM 11551]|uniref:MoxR-like ATPase n=1 Tax=Halogeometricum borinquense (strain ATCC 700274 / DSM 11551 / JCM 10706 / KCTC 4070 / PR3) TaxID=469382 RepID=L9V5A0_HALBP|nr:MoxR-like ATPase [Halogeometricum borinquense DSM 11551]
MMSDNTSREWVLIGETAIRKRTMSALARLEGRRLFKSKSVLVLFAFLMFSSWRIGTDVDVLDGTAATRSSYYMILTKPETVDAVYAIFGFVDTTWHFHSFVFLIPIVGLLLGYATIVNLRTKGQIRTMLSLPCSRQEILLGMSLGRIAVFVLALVVALAVGWIGITNNFETASVWSYLAFSASTVAYGLAWLSIGIALSVSFSTARRVSMVVTFVIVNVFVGLQSYILGLVGVFPSGMILDPTQAYLVLVAAPHEEMIPKLYQIAVGQVDSFGQGFMSTGMVSLDPPVYFSWPIAGLVLLLWIVCPLLYAWKRIEGMEVDQ